MRSDKRATIQASCAFGHRLREAGLLGSMGSIGNCSAEQPLTAHSDDFRVCTLCGVTRVNVYLPDDLATEAKKAGLNLSAVAQEAVRQVLAARSTDAWLATLTTTMSAHVPHDRALEALDVARDVPPTRHD